jgi:hypothetical protein
MQMVAKLKPLTLTKMKVTTVRATKLATYQFIRATKLATYQFMRLSIRYQALARP